MNEKFEKIIKSNVSKHDKLAQILRLIIDECHIKPDSYFILGSYAIREKREINDLDINMNDKEFEKLAKCTDGIDAYGKVEPYNNQIRWFFDLTDTHNKLTDSNAQDFSIEIFKKKPLEGFPNETFSLQRLQETNGLSKDVYGHPYFSLDTLLLWKKTMGRDKDKADIKIIEDMLSMKGGDHYTHKYIKYKNKYMNLKNGII